jgi:hypothetical protein
MFEVIQIIEARSPDGATGKFSVLAGNHWKEKEALVTGVPFEEAKKAALDYLQRLEA